MTRADRRLPHRAHDPRRHGPGAALGKPILDEALDLAQRLAEQSQSGRVDLADLGRRARRLLEATARPDDPEKLF